ncbi:DEAD/DEAH box helicase family protein [Leptothrix sp. BB-3]
MSVWDKPRVIGCAENFPHHIGLPRGCLEPALELLRGNDIAANVRDERTRGQPIHVRFAGVLREDQSNAAEALLPSDSGVLCAPTAFGKTVVASAIIARRAVSTLVLVHRTELLRQWRQSLEAFLGVDGRNVGVIGGGKDRPTGIIDVAVMQSLSRKGEVDARVEQYGQVIVDECHHIGATSFDAILRTVKARFVVGLTATPIRRDGQQPIIFMQCGPIRHQAGRPIGAPSDLVVVPRFMSRSIGLASDVPVQSLFQHLASDADRTAEVVEEVVAAVAAGRKVLVLTERTEHLAAIAQLLAGRATPVFVMQGRMSSKQRAAVLAQLDALPPDVPRVLLATGKLVGEGFDHPPLDTLILAMPISWKGTLQQYVGRLHRTHAGKSDVRVVDVVDLGHPMLERMWERRQKGYRLLGYVLKTSADSRQGELTPQDFAE